MKKIKDFKMSKSKMMNKFKNNNIQELLQHYHGMEELVKVKHNKFKNMPLVLLLMIFHY